jgi:hypothetical protein
MASPNNVNQTLIEEFRAKGGKVSGYFANSQLRATAVDEEPERKRLYAKMVEIMPGFAEYGLWHRFDAPD